MEVATAADADEPDAEPSTHSSDSRTNSQVEVLRFHITYGKHLLHDSPSAPQSHLSNQVSKSVSSNHNSLRSRAAETPRTSVAVAGECGCASVVVVWLFMVPSVVAGVCGCVVVVSGPLDC